MVSAFTIEGIPVTTAHRTVLDLVRDGTDHEDVGRVLTDALRRDMVDLRAIYEAMAGVGAEYGYPTVGAQFAAYFLEDLDPSSLSPRNLHAFARLVDPGAVTEVQRRVEDLLAGLPVGASAWSAQAGQNGRNGQNRQNRRNSQNSQNGRLGVLRDEIAAEIVGRLRWG